ncbi:MAG: hypothetical protein L0Y71_18080 [Gemmataceae bacterium]|nr:hypothetical protein [Gemmataceae bacterium]
MGFIFTAGACVLCTLLARTSLAAGLLGLLGVGYVYGIVRANFLDSVTYFMFDAAVAGAYLGHFLSHPAWQDPPRTRLLKQWLVWLVGWCGVMLLLPLQHPLIQLVGFRGNALFVPFVILGARLNNKQAGKLALGIAVLNLVALSFGLAEFSIGVPAFYPPSPVTDLIYRSQDVAGFTAFRIPATFPHAAGYAGTMILTTPLLFGNLVQPNQSGWNRVILLSGLAAAVLGVLLSASRTAFVILVVLLVVASFSGALRLNLWLVWAAILGGIGYVASSDERLQRFTTLQDPEAVASRLQSSVNLGFFELLEQYPIGNGLGAGGTSIPGFLAHLIRDPVGLENEYCRILLELGIVGLGMWVGFFIWLLTRPRPNKGHPWWAGCLLMWWLLLIMILAAVTGTGMMAAVPQAALMFLTMGFMVSRRMATMRPPPRPASATPALDGRETRDTALLGT